MSFYSKIDFLRAALVTGVALFCLSGHASASAPLKGRVLSDGKGVPGVSVTDGRTVVRTDAKGRYELLPDTDAGYVYLTVPSGYAVREKNCSPEFYLRIDGRRSGYDFELSRLEVDCTRHRFVVWADVQVYEPEEVEYVREAADDLKELAASEPDTYFHAVSCGDMVGEWNSQPPLYMPVASAANGSGVPFRYVIGNHDMDMDARTNEGSKKTFQSLFGPSYYSWDVGEIHYVVLDNPFFIGRGWQYIGYLYERQLQWLENDLSFVSEGSTVVVCMHIPSYSVAAESKEWGKEELNKITCNRNALYRILSPYNVHICSAHEHYTENYVISDSLFEHVHAPLSGLFWQSLWSMDGVPWGYTVYEIDGGNVSWYYKPVGKSRDEQFAAYPVGSDPLKPESVVVNVWNYDPAWKVCWYQDGVFMGEMTRYAGWDRDICHDVETRREKEFKWKYIGAAQTRHLFFADPDSPDADVTIEVTDRFGRVYRKEL